MRFVVRFCVALNRLTRLLFAYVVNADQRHVILLNPKALRSSRLEGSSSCTGVASDLVSPPHEEVNLYLQEPRMGVTYLNDGCTREAIGRRGVAPELDTEIISNLTSARERLVRAHRDEILGFMNCVDNPVHETLEKTKIFRENFSTQIVIGIGGSSLGARAVLESWHATPTVETHFSENIDPESFLSLMESLDLASTVFVVVSKSGTTIETMAKFWIAWSQVVDEVGEDAAGAHFIAITDPEKGAMRPIAESYGFTTFEVPPNVGGRFSVLTSVGLVPLAISGYPIESLLDGAATAREHFLEHSIADNAILRSASDHFELLKTGHSVTVMMVYADRMVGLSEWFAQLWGESLGKAVDRTGATVNTGLTPIRALGVVDQHSQVQLYVEGPTDKHIVFVETQRFRRDVSVPGGDAFPQALRHLQGRSLSEILAAEATGTRKALEAAERPTTRWVFDEISPTNVGYFLMAWEITTGLVGELLNIDAYNQPGVELGKKIAHGLLGRKGFEQWARLADAQAGE